MSSLLPHIVRDRGGINLGMLGSIFSAQAKNATRQVGHVGEAGSFQSERGSSAACSGAAVDDDLVVLAVSQLG